MFIHGDDQIDKSVSAESLRAMEHSTLKVPYENLNKRYRISQKTIDKEVTHLNQSLDTLRNHPSVGTVNEVLDNVVERLVVLKRKADEVIMDETECAQVAKRRLEHLRGAFEAHSNVAINAWKKKRFDRLLVDHLFRNGHYQSAAKLASQSDLLDLTNMKLFMMTNEIESSLLAQSTSKCLTWCHENKTKLRKVNSTLELKLRQQEFIEFIKQEKRLEAVLHARKYMSNIDASQREDLEHIMLLVVSINNDKEPYKSLLSPSRWIQLSEQFKQDNLKIYQLSNMSVFSVAIQAGLSSLKTKKCYRKNGSQNTECPICSPALNKLAEGLPFPHSSQSKLICSISGQPLNEHNSPLMLPNGFIYGEVGLKRMAAENNGRVKCPKTREEFDLDDAKRVYVM